MKRIIGIIILVPVAIVLVALSVANRHAVVLSLDPFNPATPAVAIAMPLFVVLFATLALGILVGGVAAWLGQGGWRHEARKRRREAKEATRENAALRAASVQSPGTATPRTSLPAIRRNAA